MKNKHTVIGKIQRGSVLTLAVIAALKLSSASAIAGNIKVHSDLPSALAKSGTVSHVEPGKSLNVVFILASKDPNGATEFVRRVSTPEDPLYARFLTPEQFGAAYGPTDSDYEAVKAWVTQNGLSLNELSLSHTTLSVHGTVAQFESLLATSIDNYQAPDGKIFFSANAAPSVPAEIALRLSGVIGLSNYTGFVPMVIRKPAQDANGVHPDGAGGTGPGGAYSASDLRTAYEIPTHLSPQKTQTVALFEQGGFAKSDITKYEKENGLPDVPVNVHKVNGYGGGINNPNIELEAVLDIDMVIGINPAVAAVNVYEDGDDSFGVALLDALKDIANDNTAQTISISYGTDEIIQGTTQMAAEGVLFQQLAAQGQSVFVSSGDDGAYGRTGIGLNVSDPGSQPNVTCVGGTTLFTGPNSVYADEETWNDLATGFGATGGGASTYWTIPEWQVRTLYFRKPGGFAKQLDAEPDTVGSSNGASTTMRNIPDVAAVGDPLTGVSVYSAINGGWQQVGGTSVSTPIWAGYLSIIDAAREIVGLGRFGLINPDLYFLAFTEPGLTDVEDGTNGNAALYGGIPGYSAGPGYDDCTGWGSMFGELFAANSLVVHPTIIGNVPPPPTGFSGTTEKTTADLKWTKTPRAKGYLIEVTQPGTTAVTFYIAKDTSVQLTGLTPKTPYVASLFPVNKNGTNLVSTTIYITTE
ncbi:MAG TPA: protease pro-enzyme activation domain-containing protein [Chthoniobacterales bacterium]|nr:protease pro-enzyme activation domain-containing protein [Chthoniobacterales bacterium]